MDARDRWGFEGRVAGLLACALLVLSASSAGEGLVVEVRPPVEVGEGPPVRLLVEGEQYPGGRPIEGAGVTTADGTPERFVADYTAVLREGTVADAVPFWLPGEREDARATLESVWERQRALFAQVDSTRLFVALRYGSLRLLVVRHQRPEAEGLIAVYPLVRSGDGWALSNALQVDPMFQILYLTFLDGSGIDQPLATVD